MAGGGGHGDNRGYNLKWGIHLMQEGRSCFAMLEAVWVTKSSQRKNTLTDCSLPILLYDVLINDLKISGNCKHFFQQEEGRGPRPP